MASRRRPPNPARSRRPVVQPATDSRWTAFLRGHRETAAESVRRLLTAPVTTLMTILVIAVALLLPGLLWQLESNLGVVDDNLQDTTSVSLFLRPTVTERQGLALSEDLLERAEVSSAVYRSSAAALDEFQTRSGFANLIEELDENPLPASITLVPNLESAPALETLVSELENLPEIEAIRVDLAWIERLNAIRQLVGRLATLLGTVLGLAVLLIVGNSIRMSVENRNHEINVIRLVGGTTSYIARPFLYGGLLLGCSGGVLAGASLLAIQILLGGAIDTLLSLYGAEVTILQPGIADLALLAGLGGLLGWAGALISVLTRLYSLPP